MIGCYLQAVDWKVVVLRVLHGGQMSVTDDAAATAAAVRSDAPEVSYAKQVVTCVGRDGWQWQQYSLPFSTL